jgi:hypothetical protein
MRVAIGPGDRRGGSQQPVKQQNTAKREGPNEG